MKGADFPRSSGSFVTPDVFAEEFAATLINRRIVVGFGGWPASGKSKTARRIKKKLPGSCILKLSRLILPRDIRHARGLSGVNPLGYDIDGLVSAIHDLKSGKRITLPLYDRLSARPSGSAPLQWDKGILILDGPLALLNRFSGLIDFGVSFVAEEKHTWLQFAIYRDTNKRCYEYEDSRKENERKATDIEPIMRRISIKPDITIGVRFIKREYDFLLLYRATAASPKHDQTIDST